jgi:hypothetical protein
MSDRSILVLFAVLLFAILPITAVAQIGQPHPDHSGPLPLGLDRIAASPRNLHAPPGWQYSYVFVLRDEQGVPVGGFPAGMVELDFGECLQSSTRPLDLVPADGPSGGNGHVIWRTGLHFGGSDPCPVHVLVQGNPFHTIIAADPGGLRNPDLNGDGLVALVDLTIWQQAFVAAAGGGSNTPYLCDLAPPHDDVCGVNDLLWLQKHMGWLR